MKTRNEIYQGEGAKLLRFITTYHTLRYDQVYNFSPDFSKTEVEEMFQTMFEHMPDNMKELAVKSLEALKNGKSIILRPFHQKKCRKAMLKLLSGMEEKSNSCLLPTILLAKRLQKKVTTNNLTIFYTN